MAEGGMTKIVPERRGFNKVLIQAESTRDDTRDLRHLKRMRHARSVMLLLGGEKDLCLVHQAAERLGMKDPVAVTLKFGTAFAFFA
jgi:hypothetical protein